MLKYKIWQTRRNRRYDVLLTVNEYQHPCDELSFRVGRVRVQPTEAFGNVVRAAGVVLRALARRRIVLVPGKRTRFVKQRCNKSYDYVSAVITNETSYAHSHML